MRWIHRGYCLLLALVLCIVTFLALPVSAAQDSSGKDNQSKARETLRLMVQALGGDLWLNQTNHLWWGRSAAFYKGNPTGGIIEYWEYHAWPDLDRIEYTKHRDVVQIYNGRKGWEATYRGRKELPEEQVNDFLRRRDHSIETAVRVWMRDPGTIYVYEGTKLVERRIAEQVTLISADNDTITIRTDKTTHLPLQRIFSYRDPKYTDKDEEIEEYDDYHTIDGFPTPFSITRFLNGDMTNQRFLFGAQYNVTVAPDFWTIDTIAGKIKR
jgi:hypothetical protein